MTFLDVLCVGETMAVVTPANSEALGEAEECLIGYGGAESNVATHLAEFGYRAAWASRLGLDPFGDRIAEGLAARGVDVVEPVGAGDAFAAGFLAGLLRGDEPVDRLALVHSFAAWTLGTRADFRPGHGTKPRTYGPKKIHTAAT